jgi:hypothetical protein
MSYDHNEVQNTVKAAASIMGRRGGMAKSKAKRDACRRNIAHYNAVRTRTAMTPAERKARRKAQRAARLLALAGTDNRLSKTCKYLVESLTTRRTLLFFPQ